MRCDQFAGLPRDAICFLKENETPPVNCLTCNCTHSNKLDVVGNYDGMFGNRYNLYRYPLKDGYAYEFVQAVPWSSGPIFYLGLYVYDTKGICKQTFLWDENMINNHKYC